MPKYGGTHYPNNEKGTTDGYPTHVKPDARCITNCYPEHVSGKVKDLYGNFTNRSIDDGGTGLRARKGFLNERSDFSWKYPKPTK